MHRLGTAAKNHAVAGLEAERRRVRGHVRPRFVDDADEPDGHAHLADFHAVRPPPHAEHLADRIGKRRDLAQTVRHGLDALGVQRQSVDHGLGQALLFGGNKVLLVLGDQLRRFFFKPRRHLEERVVLDLRRDVRQLTRCGLGLFRLIGNVLFDVQRCLLPITNELF